MGTEVLSKIVSWFSWLLMFRTNAEVLALIGLVLVGAVCMVYMGKGVLFLGKWLVNRKVNELLLILALTGLMLIALAIIVP